METIFIVSTAITTLAVVVCKMLLTFSERAHKAEMKMAHEERIFDIESLERRIGWLNHDIEILTSDRFSNDEKRVICHKYEKERNRKELLREQLFKSPISSAGYGKSSQGQQEKLNEQFKTKK